MEIERHPNCDSCQLYKDCASPWMESHGADDPLVMVVGEAPGCITGDSLVEVAYRNKAQYPNGIPIRDLVGRSNFYVYSYDVESESLVLGNVKRVWKTGRKRVYRVTYRWRYPDGRQLVWVEDNVKVTANHPFLIKARVKHDPFKGIDYGVQRYVSIDTGLQHGASLQPFNRKGLHQGNYPSLSVGMGNSQQESRFLLEGKLGRPLHPDEQCHHKDGNTLNDCWDNLENLSVAEHARLHTMEENPMDVPGARENHRKVVQSEEYRRTLSTKMKMVLSNPEIYAERLQQIENTNEQRSETVKELHNDPVYRYRYLCGRQKVFGWDDIEVERRFREQFPNEPYPPEDNHKVVSIEYVGIEDVYDMEVEHYHNFAVNGVFVHNSTEDRQGIPFVGKSGQLLRDTLEGLGFDLEEEVRFTNIVRCRPPDNKTYVKHINACEHYAHEELKHYDPEVVLLLGNTPLKSVLGESGITTWNGVVIERDEAVYVPLLHPAYVLRNQAAMDDWLEGFLRMKDVLEDGTKDDSYEYIYPETVGEVEAMAAHLRTCEWIAYDVETTSLDYHFTHKDEDPYSKAAVIAVSLAGGGKAYAVQFAHKDSVWNSWEMEEVRDIIEGILTEHEHQVIGHNIKFDQQFTRQCLHIEFEAGGDSMLVSHLLDSRKGIHGLKRLAGLHLGMYDYDKELDDYISNNPEADPRRGGHYGNIPLDILLPYAVMDADATLRLHDMLYEELPEKQRTLYHEMVMPMSNVVARMEFNGHKLDDYMAERYRQIYQMLQDEVIEDIISKPVVEEAVKELQDDADNKVLAGMLEDAYGGKVPEDADWDYEITAERVKFESEEKSYNRQRKIIEFNPNSYVHRTVLYYDVCDIPVTELTDAGNPSTAEETVEPFKDKFPIIGDMIKYTMYTKALGTYLEPAANGDWLKGDGLVHSNYNLHGTETGRLSSSGPNLQNIPTPESRPGTVLEYLPIKNIFTHRWGYRNGDFQNPKGVLIATDYSGMELRVFASLAKCEPMLEIHRSGRDFHTMVASMLSDIPYDEIDKSTRYPYKWTNWTLLYGGDEHTLHNLYDIPIDEAKEIVEEYYRRFPEVPEYMDWCVDYASTHGYIQSPFGRRRAMHYINDKSEENRGRRAKDRRAAVNHPVQSAASDVLNLAAIVVDDLLHQQGMEALMVNLVHDEMLGDVPIEEIDEYVELVEDVMENITEYAEVYFPNIDFSWLRCPLQAEAELGTHNGVKIKYKDYIQNGRQLP